MAEEIVVTPATVQGALNKAAPGDIIRFAPGNYSTPLKIVDRGHEGGPPIVLRGTAGAGDERLSVLSEGVTWKRFRRCGNAMADDLYKGRVAGYKAGQYPGLYPWIAEAHLTVRRCSNLVIEKLSFEKSWPTHLCLDESENIVVRECRFLDATFAIAATGHQTRKLLIEHCSWKQDRRAGRLWRCIPWYRVHGYPDPARGGKPIDHKRDYRLFDGDFFRAIGICGDVEIRHCDVRQAFNAIHAFNSDRETGQNCNFNVHHNYFEEVRDNVFEPENNAVNWWFHNNTIRNAHKWFSLESEFLAFIYIFGNLAFSDTDQGARQDDAHKGGGAFKLAEHVRRPWGPVYIFNNSFSVRGAYCKKGVLPALVHTANAIFCGKRDTAKRTRPLLGRAGKSTADAPANRFTNRWGVDEYDIEMFGDVVQHPDPNALQGLRDAGYRIRPTKVTTAPIFVSPTGGSAEGLQPRPNGPLELPAPAFSALLPDRTVWAQPAGARHGAWQGGYRYAGPAYRPIRRHRIDDALNEYARSRKRD